MFVVSSWAPVKRPPRNKKPTAMGRKRRDRFAIVCPVSRLLVSGRGRACWKLLLLRTHFLVGGGSGLRYLRKNTLPRTKIFAGLLHGARQPQPVLNVGRENVRHHVAGQFRDQAIERDRRGAALMPQPR